MACDLQIAGIHLPATPVGACATSVTVDVVNAGADPAHLPVPMMVCLDIHAQPDGPAAVHYTLATRAEAPSIQPGATRSFTFTAVRFPCAATATVTATADCQATVPNNARSAPSLSVFVPKIGAVPWLLSSLRVGLRSSTGHVNWAPAQLCPGAQCVAELSIRNAGCAAAPASVSTLELLDGAGQSLAAMKLPTAAIAAGATAVLQFVTTLPLTAAGASLSLRGCADSTGVVLGQCDLTQACATTTLPLASAGGAPVLTFTAARPIFPGEAVALSWQMQNFCADIGLATARVYYQGTLLYTSVPIAVGLQATAAGAAIEFKPVASVAASFYKAGQSKLTLEVTGSGSDPGPYTATALVTVVLEPVSANWVFTMPAPGAAAFPWKAPYVVSGRLSNPAHAAMVPSSVVLDEVASVGSPVARIASPAIGSVVPGAFGTAIWSLMQTWSWLAPGVWTPIGPLTAGFTYTVTFAMQDEYGNAYPPSTSASTFVAITVAASKIAFASVAKVFFAIGSTLVVLGFLAIAGIVTIYASGVFFAAAGVAFTLSAGFGLAALDPPVPDFDYQRIVPTRLPVLPAELHARSLAAPLLPLFGLLARINEFTTVMTATEARLIAARIDRDHGAMTLQRDEFKALRDALIAAAQQIPMAAHQAGDDVHAQTALHPLNDAELLQKQAQAWAEAGLPAKLHKAWVAQGLPAQQLTLVEQALRTSGFALLPLDALLAELTQTSAQLAQAVASEAAQTLAGLAMPSARDELAKVPHARFTPP